jgi:hypothetical protein
MLGMQLLLCLRLRKPPALHRAREVVAVQAIDIMMTSMMRMMRMMMA